MTQNEIIDMARQSGWTDDLLEVSFVSPMLERFAKLVAAKAFWVGLTDDEMEDADFHPFLRTIEAKLKEKNCAG